MKPQYVEECYPRWMAFRRRSDGHVFLCDINRVILPNVTEELADTLISERDVLVDALCEMADAFDKAAPEAFKEFWYE